MRFLFFLLLLLLPWLVKAQTGSDSSKWSWAASISPDYTNITDGTFTDGWKGRLGCTANFLLSRRINPLLSFGTGIQYARTAYRSPIYYESNYTTPKYELLQINWAELPMLVQYTSKQGQLRFYIAAGFHLRLPVHSSRSEYSYYKRTGQFLHSRNYSGFGGVPSLAGVIKPGVNFQIAEDKYLSILPAFRYDLLRKDYYGQNVVSDIHPYSVGLEIGYRQVIKPTSFPHKKYPLKDSLTLKRRNFVYVELGGNALGYSINYERSLSKDSRTHLNARIGIEALPGDFFNNVVALPLGINLAVGKTTNKLEVGIGVTPFTSNSENINASIVPSIGYRSEGRNNNFLRLALTPHIVDGSIFPWIGISYGRRFTF